MRKIYFFTLSVIFLMVAFSACDKTKTPQEYLREEKKAIDRFIDRQGIKIVDIKTIEDYTRYMEKGVENNVYFKTNDQLYFHVVDPGNGKQIKAGDEVQVRLHHPDEPLSYPTGYYVDIKTYVSGDTIKYYSYDPFSFQYGVSGSYDGYYSCDGWAIPLSFVKEGAIVNLIIPSSLGASSNSNSYRAVYFENLHYIHFK
jgi:FKBP-type peptidyl-prolyl cis-trans isomerase